MKQLLTEKMSHAGHYVKAFFRWSFLALVTGLLGGVIGSPFHIAVEKATEARAAHPWLLYFLPVAGVIIAQAERENKNDPAKHAVRFQKTVENWDTILKIIDEELPPTADIEALMKSLGMPMLPADIGVSAEDTVNAMRASRDIRDKYLSSTMMWDMGILYTYELNQK